MEKITSRSTPESEALAALRKLSSSPFDLEMPRRSHRVNLFMALSRWRKKEAFKSPHLYGGTDRSKVEWEYCDGPRFFESLKEYIGMDILNGKDILDLGCGWGGKMIYYAQHSSLNTIHGFDLPGVYHPEVSSEFAKTQNVTNCFFTTGFAEKIPYPNGKFDLILTEDVLEHVENPKLVLAECRRVLKPGGLLIAKFPSFRMMHAHHLDRAITFPALHYYLSMKTWAAGLNFLRLQPQQDYQYEPFDQVVKTEYHPCVTRNLNGLDFAAFGRIVQEHQFQIQILKCLRIISAKGPRKWIPFIFDTLHRWGIAREFLSNTILFIGQIPL